MWITLNHAGHTSYLMGPIPKVVGPSWISTNHKKYFEKNVLLAYLMHLSISLMEQEL